MKLAAAFAVVVAVLVGKSYEIEKKFICFSCVYTDQKRCMMANNLPTDDCGSSNDWDRDNGVKLVCVKTFHPKTLNNKPYDRSCQRVEAFEDYCEDFKRGKEPDTRCYTCSDALCNSSEQHLGKIILIVVVSIAAMIL